MRDSAMPVGPGAGGGWFRSAVTTVLRSVTAAAGVFAPGHLAELTRQIPFELFDVVLVEQTRTKQRRVRLLPSRVGAYFVLALALFPEVGYRKVSDAGIASIPGLDLAMEYRQPELRRRACCSSTLLLSARGACG